MPFHLRLELVSVAGIAVDYTSTCAGSREMLLTTKGSSVLVTA